MSKEIERDSIFNYITSEETAYSLEIPISEGFEWNMKDHVETTILYKNSKYKTGNSDDKPYKNIIRPILNLQYRAEGFDVKDIDLFVDSPKDYYKSFLTKKFHEKWARENNIDTFIDEIVESYVDYGGALVKKTSDARPEVVNLKSIAFCDQTDILSGAIGIKHFFSPDQLKEMESVGWGDKSKGADSSIDDLIVLAESGKQIDKDSGREADTPSKYIEVYEVHGTLPEQYLKEEGNVDKYVSQMQIVAFYTAEGGRKEGITLFKMEEKESPFKLILRDEIYGRALGIGGAEELFEPQVWVNYDMIRMKGMLDSASKVLFQTDDQAFANRNKTGDLENGEILVVEDGKTIGQIDTTPRSMALFDNNVAEWEAHAQQMGSAQDAILGESPKSGTPFKLQELVTQNASGTHEYRKGKLATFLDEIYKDWIIPHIGKEITRGIEFLAELTLDELQTVADNISNNKANQMMKDRILNGEVVLPTDMSEFRDKVKADFLKGDNKKFVKILKDEMKNLPMSVRVNIAGKQKYLSQMTDKIVNIVRQIIATPQIRQDPAMMKLFNEIIESSGLSPINFAQLPQEAQPVEQPQQQGGGSTEPLKELTQQT